MNEIQANSLKVYEIHPLGSFIIDEERTYNSYFVKANKLNILVDIPPFQVFDQFISKSNSYSNISDMTHLVIQYVTVDNLTTLRKLVELGFKGIILTCKYYGKQLSTLNLDIQIEYIRDIKYKLVSENQIVFKFIPMVFLPDPEMFMTYMPSKQTLFSSTLYSSFRDMDEYPSLDNFKKAIFAFHKEMMPSSLYLQPPLKIISKLNIEVIYPVMGYFVSRQVFAAINEYVQRLDFYNNYQVYTYDDEGQKKVNYREIINHMINHLQKYFSKIEILNTFVGTPFALQAEPLALNKSALDDYRLWHGFFEHIYVEKGISWIAILEPVVNRYFDNYDLAKPNVYLSKFIEMTLKSDSLDQKTTELEDRIARLTAEIEETKDQFMRCSITHLYNQDFFKSLLTLELNEEVAEDHTKGFVLVNLDQLNDINRKFGNETGDESIRNMSYLLEQIKDPQSLLFKQDGPGVLIYLQDTDFKHIQKVALDARNEINESDLFIEKVSASVSTVDLSEINRELPVNEQVKEIFTLLEKRMLLAKNKGTSLIIDKEYKLPTASEGSILLVDEDETNLNMLNRIFQRNNFEVKIARGVEEAIEIIDKTPIDIIISEINLSKIDGFTLKKTLNESKDFQKIPFIMVSHNKTLENIKRGNSLSVNLILEKPIVPDELIGHVLRYKDWMRSL
ncbi:MAG: hypothetical protein CVV58_00990 [Tenericutes bacterium HGW-Tenericutes-3]|nr:MAG: hypothetical protein CVV58_00990 [Tenericutes bacterium HGW-Tenericutes-3]